MDFNEPAAKLAATVKLRGSSDGAPVLWWYRGNQYAVVDRQPTLLWQVEGAQLGRYIEQEDGSFEHVFRDVMFYLDASTGELLEGFENPFTGQRVEPPVMRMGPFRTNHSVNGAEVQLPPNLPPGAMEVVWAYEPAVVQGDDLYLRETGSARIANPAKDADRAFFFINDFFTLIGRVSDVTNPELLSAPARTSYQSINEWTPWLQMGEREGFVFGRGDSTKLSGTDELPEKLATLVREHEPGFFEDPDFPLWDKTYTPLNQEG